ncbi:glycosyltransferase family 4 protein [Paracoccus sp. Z118]|uniref:glycosyltransferase family 4 protein n=1 Tax=Paracoccus sp. Z118 TaxID=2851017 RepID=UPI001C2C682A|nr:glycosyltransferase family 4 protein [Paracoccus sp. Z118]MBV0892988.1 glycosyltransferase family 4 protein [Paracoccus sp. Z118]
MRDEMGDGVGDGVGDEMGDGGRDAIRDAASDTAPDTMPHAKPDTAPRNSPSRPLRRITHVTEAPLGGVVSYLDELIGGQLRSLPSVQIDLITPEINRPALADLSGPRFGLIAFPHRRGSPRALLSMALRTLRHVRRTRPDILHIHSTFAGAAIRPFAPLFPRETRVVYCPHGWAFARQGSARTQRAAQAVERWLAPRADAILCISDHERREAEAIGIPAARLVVIENGISPRKAAAQADTAPLPQDSATDSGPDLPPHGRHGRKMIAFAGRFDRQKGFDTFLNVMRQLEGEADGIAIGSAITSSAALPDCPPNVHILGWQSRDAVFDLYRRADLLLVPSRWEGFGLVAAEAMQAGLAVFASRVGGLQDIVVDGETGRLVRPDDVDGIVELIRATSEADLARFGANGRRRYLARYTSERMVNEITALYAGLLNGNAGR